MSMSYSRASSKMRSIWPGGSAVDIRRATDGAAAALERLDHQFVGAGIVEQTFLREHADLQVDRPGIFLDQRQHAFEPAQADAGIDLEMRAHMGGALQDRLLKRAPPRGRGHPPA